MTHLECWLQENERTVPWLSAKLGISRESATLLTRPGTWRRQFHSVRFDVLIAVSRLTGIPPGVLIEDAMAWEADDGKAAAAQ